MRCSLKWVRNVYLIDIDASLQYCEYPIHKELLRKIINEHCIIKPWENEAIRLLDKSLVPIPQELNELDWKQDISGKDKKRCQHLSAFANYPGGGIWVFGVNKEGKIIEVIKGNISGIIERVSNLSRDGVEPVVQIDHSIFKYRGSPILLLHIKKSSIKPVYLKGKPIEMSYIRSGGTTRLASRHELGAWCWIVKH